MSRPVNRNGASISVAPGASKGVLFDNNGKGMRQVCCPGCKANNVKPTRDARGREVYVCGCGARFTSTRM